MILEQHYLGCLSQASYFIGDEKSATAAVVDPRRDVDEYMQEAAARGMTIRHIFLTHFHADFASGHLELHEKTGATIYLGTGAQADYDFTTLEEGDAVVMGEVEVRALWTPGHTPESTCYLVFDRAKDAERPRAVLTGDTLFIGDVGRPDLMASQGVTAEELAGSLYDSLRDKLLTLPDETIVYPGHGAGSSCGKNLSRETSSTIGVQRAINYALQPMTRPEFIRIITAGQPTAPAYFPHDARFNRERHDSLHASLARALAPLSLDEVLKLQGSGAVVLDVRGPAEFSAGHLVGSLCVGIDGRFAQWVGTVLPASTDIVLLAEPGREKEAIVRLGRIGFDRVMGFLEGGIEAIGDRIELRGSFRRYTPGELASELESPGAPRVVDIREHGEREGSHIAGSIHIPLGEFPARASELPATGDIVVHCAGGYRSAIAASILRRRGLRNVSDLQGGIGAWEDAGHPTVTGAPSSGSAGEPMAAG
jgi:glyoxylase-like metal-dependent hydrolase (beta-lactamase superfamily II)/rhodanese-related sulfurtransferase